MKYSSAAAGAPGRALRHRGSAALSSLVFVLPGLCVYIIFLVYPTGKSLWYSFTNWDGLSAHASFIGFQNYHRMLSDPTVAIAVKNNLLWSAVTIIVPVVLGFLLAMLLNGALHARPVLRTLFYMPAVIPSVSVATIWSWLYLPSSGAINVALRDVGLGSLAQGWLGQNSTALFAVMVPAIWVGVGFPMLLYLAALQGIPRERYEAAMIDGANGFQQFRHVTMPGVRSTHYIVLALSFIGSVKAFDLIYAMTDGGPGNTTQVLATWMYANVFQFFHVGYGTAIAVVVGVLALLVGIPYAISQAKDT